MPTIPGNDAAAAEPARQPTKAEHVRIIEETLARHDTPGATAESIDAALRDARGE